MLAALPAAEKKVAEALAMQKAEEEAAELTRLKKLAANDLLWEEEEEEARKAKELAIA